MGQPHCRGARRIGTTEKQHTIPVKLYAARCLALLRWLWCDPVVPLLIVVLIAPRVAIYFTEGPGNLTSDSTARYIPQAIELLSSPTAFFAQTGSLYSLFLATFEAFCHDMLKGPIVVQHLIGVCTGVACYILFRPLGRIPAVLASLLVFGSDRSIGLEHLILRDSLTAAMLMLLYGVLLREPPEEKEGGVILLDGALLGLLGFALVLLRVEYFFLVLLTPAIRETVILKSAVGSGWFSWRRLFLRLVSFCCPLLLLLSLSYSFRAKTDYVGYHGSHTVVAYYSLNPRVFSYHSSKYPELLAAYRAGFAREVRGGSSLFSAWSTGYLAVVLKANEDYLAERPWLHLTIYQLLDRVFLDMVLHNPYAYAASYANNLVEHVRGSQEQIWVSAHPRHPHSPLLSTATRIAMLSTFLTPPAAFNALLMVTLPLALLLLIWRFRRLPRPILVATVFFAVHLSVLAAVANPTSRFRYPLDPFLFIVVIYSFWNLIPDLVRQLYKRRHVTITD